MNNPYDLHSWSTQYRAERLAETRVLRLVEQARVGRELRGLRRVGLAWSNPLALLRRAEFSE